jgi:assimilatory nitrate reductase catalytic subunit
VPEPTTAKFPLTLLTGRGSSSQWHTQTRTGKSAVLRRLAPRELHVEISPVDARALGVLPNAWVEVESIRGSVRARAFVTNAVRPGQVFLPMHDAQMNKLTFPAVDPYSRQPSYKHCAVKVTPAGPA